MTIINMFSLHVLVTPFNFLVVFFLVGGGHEVSSVVSHHCKEFLLALHEGCDHKLKVLVLNKPRKERGRPKISYGNPSTQPAKFSRYLWMSIHARE